VILIKLLLEQTKTLIKDIYGPTFAILLSVKRISPYIFISVIRSVKRYTRFVGKYVTEGSVFDPVKYIYS